MKMFVSITLVCSCILPFIPGGLFAEMVTTRLGGVVRLNCSTTAGGKVEWRLKKESSLIFDYIYLNSWLQKRYELGGRHNVSLDPLTGAGDLVITNVTESDAGKYYCKKTIGRNESHFELVVLLVNDPTCRTSNLSNVLVDNDCGIDPDYVEFNCSIAYRGNVAPLMHLQMSTIGGVLDNMSAHNWAQPSGNYHSVQWVSKARWQMRDGHFQCEVRTTMVDIHPSCSSGKLSVMYFYQSNRTEKFPSNADHSKTCVANTSEQCSYSWLRRHQDSTKNDNFSGATIDLAKQRNDLVSMHCRAECKLRGISCVAQPWNIELSSALEMPSLAIFIGLVILAVIIIVVIACGYIYRSELQERLGCNQKREEADNPGSRDSFFREVPADSNCATTSIKISSGILSENRNSISIRSAASASISSFDSIRSTAEFENEIPFSGLRSYQLELAKDALDGSNSIICAPTSCGKTWTAGFICQERRKTHPTDKPPFKVIFLLCQRALLLQKKTTLMESLGVEWQVETLENEDDNLQSCMQMKDIVVLTAHKFLNSLTSETASVNLWDITVLIMDEFHHTDGKHPYNEIMKVYYKCKRDVVSHGRLPQIIGLTASLDVGTEKNLLRHYVKLCASLDCFKISHVQDPKNINELNKFSPNSVSVKIIPVNPRPNSCPFYDIMSGLMKEFEGLNDLTGVPPSHGSQSYTSWIAEQRDEATKVNGDTDKIIVCDALEKLNLAWMLHNDFQIKDAKKLLDNFFQSDAYPAGHFGEVQKTIFGKYTEAQQKLQILVNSEMVEDCPRMNQLCKLLDKLYGDGKKEAKGILLTRAREEIDLLLTMLDHKFRNIIFPGKIVSRHGKDNTMTQAEQENAVRCFRLGSEDKGQLNLLVATNLALKGLPKCNFAILYNIDIGSAHPRGRARAVSSEIPIIVARGSINETRELVNAIKEQSRMQEVLQKGDKESEEQLEKKIREQQDKNWNANIRQEDIARQLKTRNDVNSVGIYCSICKSFLCSGKDMRLKDNDYICVDESFPNKIHFTKSDKETQLRNKKEIGRICCNCESCRKNNLGVQYEYNRGSGGIRSSGYALRKDGCVWKVKNSDVYTKIAQWSKVPFEIQKEDI